MYSDEKLIQILKDWIFMNLDAGNINPILSYPEEALRDLHDRLGKEGMCICGEEELDGG